jgi:predicted ATPase
VQEAAYESLLKRTRQQLRGRAVDVLRKRFPERVEREPELVARHAEVAGQTDDAITYYGRASGRRHARHTGRRSGSSARRSASSTRGRRVRSATSVS